VTDAAGDSGDWHASATLHWPATIANLEAKTRVAERVAAVLRDGETVGLGSGSAAYLALWAIGRRASREGLQIRVVPTSYETETAAVTLGLPTLPLGRAEPDWGVDGADEIDPHGRLLKGRGGALFREKILWATSRRMYLAIDATKRVDRLGSRFPVPVEVDPAAVSLLARALEDAGAVAYEVRLGGGKDGPVITEAGNLIVDARFDEIPFGLHAQLKALPGVIETGLFEGYRYDVVEP
jgi:ribose 5-phosphate isomerase A